MSAKLFGVIFIAFLFVLEVKRIDAKQFSDEKLVEVEVIDENGNIKMKVMAQSAPDGDRNSKDDSKGAGVDDEDSKSTGDGSGDSDMNNDQLQSDVAHDQPMAAISDIKTSTTTFSPSPSPTASTANIMTAGLYSTMTIISTTQSSSPSSNSTVATIPRATSVQPSLTSSKSTLIAPTSVLTSTQVVARSPSVTEFPTTTTFAPEVKTESKTTAKTTTDEPSNVFTTQTNINNPTTKYPSAYTNGTEEPVVTEKVDNSTIVPATGVRSTDGPTKKSTESSVDVRARHETTEKPARTLFGFVTVEILIALLAGALFSILLVAFLVYRLKKRNEGSYELSETIALRPKELDEMGAKKEVFV